MKPSVAVIILNWNGKKLLESFLPSVVCNTNQEIADVIVADNGSSDDSLEYLRESFPNVKTLAFDKNYGFAEGYNRAIKQTEYKYTVLLNSDVSVPEHWLEPMFEYMEANANVGACQPKLMSHLHKDLFEYAGGSGGFIDCNGYPYCRGRIFSSIERDNGQYDDVTDVFWATGAALFVRTDVYLKAGGLDKDFFAHMEEIDLCWRIHLLGYDIKVIPQSVVYHLGGGSLPASNPRKTYLNFRNNLLLLHKNLPQADVKKVIFRRMLWDALAFGMFVATLQFGNASAVVRAHRDFKKMRMSYGSHPEKNLLKTFPGARLNIVTAYYLHGKKYFSDLSE